MIVGIDTEVDPVRVVVFVGSLSRWKLNFKRKMVMNALMQESLVPLVDPERVIKSIFINAQAYFELGIVSTEAERLINSHGPYEIRRIALENILNQLPYTPRFLSTHRDEIISLIWLMHFNRDLQ